MLLQHPALTYSPPLEGWQAQPDGVVSPVSQQPDGVASDGQTTPRLRRTPPTEGNLPQLRFPEFKDAGAWEVKPVNKWLTIGSGKDYKHLSTGNVPVYGTGGYMLSVNEYLYDGESVCIGRKGTIDKPMFLSGKFWTVDTLFYTHSFVNCLPKFIYSCFQNIEWSNYNEASGVPSLSKVTIGQIEIAVPSLPEQQKIAACLSSLDDLITAENQQLEALKTHKKGLMQSLFPNSPPLEGWQAQPDGVVSPVSQQPDGVGSDAQTTPRLRRTPPTEGNLPQLRFKDVGVWEEKRLGDLCRIGDIDHRMPQTVSNGIPYLMTGDFTGINGLDFENAKLVSQEDYEQLSKKIKPELGDVLFARYASVGAVRYVDTNKRFLISYSCAIIKPSTLIEGQYLYYTLQSSTVQNKVEQEINTGSQRNIGIDSLKNLIFSVPKNKEQQKIAACLSSLDDLISAQSQKIEALKQHKKGLMQQLFPNANLKT